MFYRTNDNFVSLQHMPNTCTCTLVLASNLFRAQEHYDMVLIHFGLRVLI